MRPTRVLTILAVCLVATTDAVIKRSRAAPLVKDTLYLVMTIDRLYLGVKEDRLTLCGASESNCERVQAAAEPHQGGVTFMFSLRGVCHFMCLDRCGYMYYEREFFTEDCKFTTVGMDGVETLSVHRGNYSDFVMHYNYELIPFSMRNGDSRNRLAGMLEMKFRKTTDAWGCSLPYGNNSAPNKPCGDRFPMEEGEYNPHAGYPGYSLWEKFLFMLGWGRLPVPNEYTQLIATLEYDNRNNNTS